MNVNKTVLATMGFAVATAFAGSALAQSKESGAYLGLSLGQSRANDVDCTAGFSCDKTDMAWKIFGGYQFMRYLAAEGGYTNLGKIKASTDAGGTSASVSSKSTAWELLAVGSYPIGTSGFAPYVKAGFYSAETKSDISLTAGGASTSGSFKKTNTDWTAGLGVRYDFMKNFAVRAEWQRYNGVGGGDHTVTVGGVSASTSGDSTIDVFSLGAIYKF